MKKIDKKWLIRQGYFDHCPLAENTFEVFEKHLNTMNEKYAESILDAKDHLVDFAWMLESDIAQYINHTPMSLKMSFILKALAFKYLVNN